MPGEKRRLDAAKRFNRLGLARLHIRLLNIHLLRQQQRANAQRKHSQKCQHETTPSFDVSIMLQRSTNAQAKMLHGCVNILSGQNTKL